MNYSRAMFFNIRYQPKKRAGLAEVEERGVDEGELPELAPHRLGRPVVLVAGQVADVEGAGLSTLGWLHRSIGQTSQGSFSVVSKSNFASKYSLESSRRDLHNALLCTVL